MLFDIEQIDVLVENLLEGQWNVGGRGEFFCCELGKIGILFDGIFDGLGKGFFIFIFESGDLLKDVLLFFGEGLLQFFKSFVKEANEPNVAIDIIGYKHHFFDKLFEKDATRIDRNIGHGSDLLIIRLMFEYKIGLIIDSHKNDNLKRFD